MLYKLTIDRREFKVSEVETNEERLPECPQNYIGTDPDED